jgi:tetratricopeptide (TPR) repeat protein
LIQSIALRTRPGSIIILGYVDRIEGYLFMPCFRFIVALMLCAGVTLAASPARADTGAEAPLAPSAVNIESVFKKLEVTWTATLAALPTASLGEIHEKLQEIGRLQQQAGIVGLDGYSIALIKEAHNRLALKDVDAARYLTRRALEISPQSPRVHFDALAIGGTLGIASPWTLGFTGLSLLPRDPALMAKVIVHTLYPAAWALTLGLYVAFVIFCFFWLVELLRSVAYLFPVNLRGIAAPIGTFFILATPIFFGPIVCLFVWGLFVWSIDRRRVWPCLLTGIVLCMWGIIIPVRERLVLWLDEPGTQTLLAYSSGVVSGADRYQLEKLAQTQRTNGLAWLAYGQLLRRYGDYQGALKTLDAAERQLKGSSLVAAERAVSYSLLGDYESARKDLAAAEAAGLSTVEFYFNYSKVASDDIDTAASRDYLTKAARADPVVLAELKKREDAVGSKHPSTYAEVRMPVAQLLDAMWEPRFSPDTTKSRALLPGCSSLGLCGIGIVLCLLPLLPFKRGVKRRLSPYYAEYAPSRLILALMRLLPGGPWAMRGRGLYAFIASALIAFLLMPMLGWPAESRWLSELYPSWVATYSAFTAIVTIGVIVVGFAWAEE